MIKVILNSFQIPIQLCISLQQGFSTVGWEILDCGAILHHRMFSSIPQ